MLILYRMDVRYRDFVLAAVEADTPLAETAERLGMTLSQVNDHLNSPEFVAARARIECVRTYSQVYSQHIISKTLPNAVQALADLVDNPDHPSHFHAAKWFADHEMPAVLHPADARDKHADTEAKLAATAALRESTSAFMQLMESTKPTEIGRPVLEGTDALPMPISMKDQRRVLDG